MATFTKRHLYELAEQQVGHKGDPNDWESAKKALLAAKDEDGEPAPFDKVKFGSETIDIANLVFQKESKSRSRTATFFATADDTEGAEDKLNALVAKGVEDALAKRNGPKGNGRVTPVSETVIGTVKGGEERQYEHRIKNGTSVFKSYDMAWGFGRDIQVKALRALQQHDAAQTLYTKSAEQLTQKGYTLLTTASGSALVPEGYDADLWQLLLEYGVARKACRVAQMSSETLVRPKASGDLTVYYPADGTAGTESTKTFTNVQMRAKEGMVITKASRAIVQDSAINVADDAGRDIVRAVAKVEDNSVFNSDGSGVAGGYIPGTQGILNIVSETTTGSRLFKGAGTTPAATTLAEVMATMSTPGRFVGRQMAFHCTPQIGGVIFHRLAASTGGINSREIQGLGLVDTFLNIPIIYNNVMTTNLGTGSNRQLFIFGDLSLAADFGDRMGLSVEISEQRYWDENNIGIKGTVRHDLNVHGLGTSSTTGPLAVFIQA